MLFLHCLMGGRKVDICRDGYSVIAPGDDHIQVREREGYPPCQIAAARRNTLRRKVMQMKDFMVEK